MALITINGNSLDPIAQEQQLGALEPEIDDAGRSGYILVQTEAPLTREQREALAAAGAAIEEYVPEDTYLCTYQPSDLAPVRALPFVSWAGVYLVGFKINPALLDQDFGVGARSLVPAELPVRQTRKPRYVDVVMHGDVDTGNTQLLEGVAAAAGIDAADLEPGRRKVRLTVTGDRLPALADIDQVHHIEAVPERQLFNNRSRVVLNADVVVNGTTYLGDGQVVAVADTGLDKGSRTDVHAAFAGRVDRLYALGRPNPPRSDDPQGHGTHVAGSVLGDGTSATEGGHIQGAAPEAHLVFQSTLDKFGRLSGIPADLTDLFDPPYNNDGARVHTNSWGAVTPALPYDQSANEIDEFVWNNPDQVICFAAGNDGGDGDLNGVIDSGSIGSQSAAKNCITVGASEGNRPEINHSYSALGYSANPIKSDLQADNIDGMAAFSSRGPTQEGRIKPDVVAPGTSILSTRSRNVASPPISFGTSTDPSFFYDSGTSMATPLVAGCAAVLRETLVKNGTPNPSAALIKALLINGAVELAGQYSPSEAGASPNNNSGWGRVNLAGSVIIPGTPGNAGLGEGGPLDQGEENTVTIDMGGGRRGRGVAAVPTLKVTLVWSDPPGPALQNDLDLIVRIGRTERHGNVGANSDAFDRTNNVEQVVWTNPPTGQAKIIVRAHRITNFPQPYAYVWRLS